MRAIYTVADVAMMLGISDETVRRGAAADVLDRIVEEDTL